VGGAVVVFFPSGCVGVVLVGGVYVFVRFVVDVGVVIFVVGSFVVDSFVVGLVVIFVVGSFVVGFVVIFVVGFGVVGQFFSSDPSSQSLNPSQTVLFFTHSPLSHSNSVQT